VPAAFSAARLMPSAFMVIAPLAFTGVLTTLNLLNQ
jgi:hypothetical protein